MKKITYIIALACFLSLGGNSFSKAKSVNAWMSGNDQYADLRVNKYVDGELDSYTLYIFTNTNYPSIKEYRIVDGVEQLFNLEEKTYDSAGNEIYSSYEYYENGILSSSVSTTLTYDWDNILINRKGTNFYSGEQHDSEDYTYEYIYDQYKCPIDLKEYDNLNEGVLSDHHVYTYNSLKLLETDTQYDCSGASEIKKAYYTYTYDSVTKNKLSSETYFYEDGVESHYSTESWEYDTSGNLTKHLFERLEDNNADEELYEYDSKNRNIKYSCYNYESSGERFLSEVREYEYYKNTNEYTKESCFSYLEGELMRSDVVEYDFGCCDVAIKACGTETREAYGIAPKAYTLEYVYKTDSHHVYEPVEGKEPTTKEDGYKDCFKCSVCGKYFSEEQFDKEIGANEGYEAWKIGDGKIDKLGIGSNVGLIVGVSIGSLLLLLIILFVVSYIIWKKKGIAIKLFVPMYRGINKLFFKTTLNDIELKEGK